MKQYLEVLKEILDKGEYKDDRTCTGVYSVFGKQMRFNLKEGFPLLTTKQMFTRGGIEELLWFLSGSTDVKELQKKNVHFWDSWVDENGTIGHGYGKQFRNLESYTEVTPKTFEPEQLAIVRVGELPEPKYETDSRTTKFSVGEVFETIYSGKFKILEEIPADKTIKDSRISWVVGSLETGFITHVPYRNIQKRQVFDPWYRRVFGVGYLGEPDKEDPYYEILRDTWREMLRRCYHEDCKGYACYGGRGVHVANSWHCFANFQQDAKGLPQWELKAEYTNEYSLDKDIRFASNRYSKETCKWACRKEQAKNKEVIKPFTALSPWGETVLFYSLEDAKDRYGLNMANVSSFCCGNSTRGRKSVSGWTQFQKLDDINGKVVRYNKVDQIKNLIAGLKHCPNSRRHVISLWNPFDIERTTLPPCHGSVIQFFVSNNKLSCQMYQRSADIFLGVPVNIMVYSLLTMMVAQVCDYEVGEFIWTGGDVHLYSNHVEQARLQLSRTPLALPVMKINKAIKNIDDFTANDFELVGYEHLGKIQAPVAV